MKYNVFVNIMPVDEILDPQGKATLMGLHNLGFQDFEKTRIGKRIQLVLDASSDKQARTEAEKACQKLLVNQITEQFEIDKVIPV